MVMKYQVLKQGQRYCRKDTKEIKQKKGAGVWKSSNKPN